VLAKRGGGSFEGLLRARQRSEAELGRIRDGCAALKVPAGCAVVVEGSLGRMEMTSGSDVDFSLLALDDSAADACDSLRSDLAETVAGLGLRMPSAAGHFGAVVALSTLETKIGGDPDTNLIVTHRMLLLLESAPVAGVTVWETGVRRLLDVYLRKTTLKDRRPPRFLLNDLIRYWRTMCVDYEGKLRQSAGQKWAIRNAKLRTVRKMLFASGLFPLLECSEKSADEIHDFLAARLRLPPMDRIAAAALQHDGIEAGTTVLSTYSHFLERLDDPSWRSRLEALPVQERAVSTELREVKEMGSKLQRGLTRLLFETDLGPVARDYLVF
jgi:hypothetical protein